ncbi:E3 ubiquitin-protein ligase TRIM71-like [Diadema setosum]|uniref:E3 ubiquitin-protein ligase TRIM71-like n=1 Tax=Diadema setosum TaxID=31175 RepID=UPI003B3BD9FD
MATFHQISSQNLECPICLTLFNQPKSLTCSHTFCKDCLQRIFQTRLSRQTITCPICRKETPVPGGNVSKLQTNAPLNSLVDEVKTKNPICTVCETDENLPAVSYCQDCGKYMCESCEKTHSNWKLVSNHKVVAMREVLSGKVPLERRRKCKKHPNDDEEYFCTKCREYICGKCGMVRHLQAGHQIEEATIHEENLKENIKELQKGAKSKKTALENHIAFIKTQRNEITNMMKKLNNNIEKTYEEYMQRLLAERETLKGQVKRCSDKFEKELQVMEEKSRRTLSHMTALEELVTNGVKVPLEKDALFAHDTLCQDLKSFLERDDPDDQSPRFVAERAQKISFCKEAKVNELCLGALEGYTWDVKAEVELPGKDNMTCITLAPDGKMAVGSWKGGIHLYSADGDLKQTVLKDVSVCNIGYLSDGLSVVRDGENKLSLYTEQWEKLNVTFEAINFDKGGFGGLTVDKDDSIYVGYRESKMIQVFTPRGGFKAVREIMCSGYIMPCQLFHCHTTRNLILTDTAAVVCLDGVGKNENVVLKEGMSAWPAVCRDDSVIVAWVTHEDGLVSIDRYTRDLEHVCNIVTNVKIQKSGRGWYYLQEFESGEIAFCTTDRLYIFEELSCKRCYFHFSSGLTFLSKLTHC